MLKLRDIMTSNVITVSPDLTLRETMELLATKHVSGAPVVSGGRVAGVISATDLLSVAATLPGVPIERPDESELEELDSASGEDEEAAPTGAHFTDMWSDEDIGVDDRFEDVTGSEWNALDEHTVAEFMTREVLSLPSNTDVSKAADYMRRAGVHRLLVMDEGRLCGIVSTLDIATAVAERRLVHRTFVFNKDRYFDERRE